MANPNIVNVGSIRGQTAYCVPSTASSNTVNWTYDGTAPITGLTPAAGNVHRITSLIAANFTGNAAGATVAIGNNATFNSSNLTVYAANNISVPANSTLIIIDKTNSIYITENQSVSVSSDRAGNLSFQATFEQIRE